MKITTPKSAPLRAHVHRILLENKGMWLSARYIDSVLGDTPARSSTGVTSTLNTLLKGKYISMRPTKGVPIQQQKRAKGDQPKYLYTFEKLYTGSTRRKTGGRKAAGQQATPPEGEKNVFLSLAYEILASKMTKEEIVARLIKAAVEGK